MTGRVAWPDAPRIAWEEHLVFADKVFGKSHYAAQSHRLQQSLRTVNGEYLKTGPHADKWEAQRSGTTE